MDINYMTNLDGKGKKPTELTINIKCYTRISARNIRLCIMELLKKDLKIKSNRINVELKDCDVV